jgi:SAM-dependent methyltransferase
MDPFQEESERLRYSWDKLSAEHLDTYLVAGVEDPRINFQSILTRALIADTLFPGEFTGLIDEEWRFGLCMTWIVRRLQDGFDRQEIFHEIASSDAPDFVCAVYNLLQQDDCPIADYLTEALFVPTTEEGALISHSVLDTFEFIWNRTLEVRPEKKLRILEPACGSANDYRFIESYGLARFLDYTGFDISEKNIENARTRFPGIDFRVGNVLEIPLPDKSIDYLFVHDLFEHLSPAALEQSLREIRRVTRVQAWLSFFNLADIPNHEFRPVEAYYWNTLSQDQIKKTLDADIETVDVHEIVQQKFGYADYHNPEAKTLIVTM